MKDIAKTLEENIHWYRERIDSLDDSLDSFSVCEIFQKSLDEINKLRLEIQNNSSAKILEELVAIKNELTIKFCPTYPVIWMSVEEQLEYLGLNKHNYWPRDPNCPKSQTTCSN